MSEPFTDIVPDSTTGLQAATELNKVGNDVVLSFRCVSELAEIENEINLYKDKTIIYAQAEKAFYQYDADADAWNPIILVGGAIASKTGDYGALISDNTILVTCSDADITITLPAVATSTGWIFNIKKMDGTEYSVIVDGADAETIDGETTKEISGQYDCVTVQCTGTEWIIL